MTQTKPLALVTGASSGIGLALARQFAQNGYDLMITAEDEAQGLAQSAQALETLGAAITQVGADLSTAEGVEQLISEIKASGRPLDAVAINAGVGVGGDFTRETDLSAELKLIQLNVTSSVYLAKYVAKEMVSRGEGRILFTASIAATMPCPFEAVYGASKAFVFSFSQSLRNELKDTGVSVTALLPGPTETNFFHRAGMDDTKVGTDKKDDPDDVAREGFDALMSGKDYVVAGSLKNKIQVTLGKITPEDMKADQHRQLSEPGSAYR